MSIPADVWRQMPAAFARRDSGEQRSWIGALSDGAVSGLILDHLADHLVDHLVVVEP